MYHRVASTAQRSSRSPCDLRLIELLLGLCHLKTRELYRAYTFRHDSLFAWQRLHNELRAHVHGTLALSAVKDSGTPRHFAK